MIRKVESERTQLQEPETQMADAKAKRKQARATDVERREGTPEQQFVTVQPAKSVELVLADALQWMSQRDESSIHAIVTDPPYSLVEYETTDLEKLRRGVGGVWRIPPSFDGANRAPLPRFTVLNAKQREQLNTFFEKRGSLIRIVKTLRGGDRPKNAEEEFADVSVMPRSNWEPWGLFRKPLSESTVAENLRRWGTGGFRRISDDEPWRDIVECPPARGAERELAPHPSLKPQRLMRYIVRGVLPLGKGIVYDPFSGSGSTLAAAAHLGIKAIGTERDAMYFKMAAKAIPDLAMLQFNAA
jgi:site-specific DNA-methyltransferase (adenine-specific)